jgi:hypothetical protein
MPYPGDQCFGVHARRVRRVDAERRPYPKRPTRPRWTISSVGVHLEPVTTAPAPAHATLAATAATSAPVPAASFNGPPAAPPAAAAILAHGSAALPNRARPAAVPIPMPSPGDDGSVVSGIWDCHVMTEALPRAVGRGAERRVQ